MSFLPYSGYTIDKVTLNGVNITSDIVNNQYTISDINNDVLLNVSFKTNPLYLTIKQTNAATIKQEVKAREQYEIAITPSEGWKITNVMFNDYDVTNQVLNNNSYTTPRITQSSELRITQEPLQYEEEDTEEKDQIIKKYDLNGDGKVNVADHVKLSEIILNQNK